MQLVLLTRLYINSAMKRNHMDYFMMCHALASRSQHSRFHHGSIAVQRRGRILGRGSNRKNLHAEVCSITNIPNYHRYENLVVYVCRVNSTGGFMNSRPCQNCLDFMRDNGVCRVYFSDSVGFSKLIF